MTLRGGSAPKLSHLSPEELEEAAMILWKEGYEQLSEKLLSEIERLKEYEWMYRSLG